MCNHFDVLANLNKGAVDSMMFPELLLINYYPDIAESMVIDPGDTWFSPFQGFAHRSGIFVGNGIVVQSSWKL